MGFLDIFKDSVSSLNKKDVELLSKGDYQGALEYFNKALELELASYKT